MYKYPILSISIRFPLCSCYITIVKYDNIIIPLYLHHASIILLSYPQYTVVLMYPQVEVDLSMNNGGFPWLCWFTPRGANNERTKATTRMG